MMNMALAAVLLCQDPEVSVRVRRQGGEYDLTLTGKALTEESIVRLTFQRRINRMDWTSGVIETVALDSGSERCAVVEDGRFVHKERFTTAGEFEVRIVIQREDGEDSRGDYSFRRIVRIGSAAEGAVEILEAARKMDSALAAGHALLDGVPSLRGVRRCRGLIAEGTLSASAGAFLLLLEDSERALEMDRSVLISALTGEPFSWEKAREALVAVEALSLRERGLLFVREVDALRHEAVSDRGFLRAIGVLREMEEESRSRMSGSGTATLGGLLQALEVYVQSATGSGEREERQQTVMEMASALEHHFRGLK
jgi:hypothetical protein